MIKNQSLTSGIAVLVLGCAVLVYELAIDSMKITYERGEMRDNLGRPREVFRRGEPLFMHRRICKDRDAAGVVDRELLHLETNTIYPLSRVPTGVFVGCTDRTIALDVPVWLPAGRYEFRSRALYHLNALLTYGPIAPSIYFEIKD